MPLLPETKVWTRFVTSHVWRFVDSLEDGLVDLAGTAFRGFVHILINKTR